MICHQTVPAVPPHLAEDGIALVAPLFPTLSMGQVSLHTPRRQREGFSLHPLATSSSGACLDKQPNSGSPERGNSRAGGEAGGG